MNESSANYVGVNELNRLLREDSTITLIDTRTPEEFADGHASSAINVPITNLTEFAENRGDTSDDLVITMCGSTGRGEKAAAILNSHGVRKVRVLEGGLKAWRDAGLPVA
jgi:rhodanese-related sulfurtransferase